VLGLGEKGRVRRGGRCRWCGRGGDWMQVGIGGGRGGGEESGGKERRWERGRGGGEGGGVEVIEWCGGMKKGYRGERGEGGGWKSLTVPVPKGRGETQ